MNIPTKTQKLLLLLFLFTPFLLLSQQVQLYQQFNGRLDFTAFGNTLNEFPNSEGTPYCGQLPSSDATLNLSSGQTLVSAHLYWGSIGTGDFDVDLNGNAITADRVFNYNSTSNGQPYFSAYTDVTNIVAAAGNGSYTFSGIDVQAQLPNYCGHNFGGWAIYVIYSDPSLRLNQISLFDGLDGVTPTNNTLSITLTNIDVTSDILSKIGFLAWEGEESVAVNESLRINGILIDNPPLNPGNNAFNGTNSYTGSNVNYNMDLDFYDLAGIVMPGDTSVQIDLTSDSDFVMVNNVITSVNSELSDATIAIDDVGVLCENDDMTIDYTVYNINSTAPLALNTPIAVYADAVLIGQTQTVADIPIGGSESGSITVNIPIATPNIFNLRVVVDDVGNGTGVVDETDETNNEAVEVIDLGMAGILLAPGPACIGSGVVLDSGVTDPPFNIQWFVGAVPIAIPGATNSTLNVTVDGIYSVVAVDGICRVTSNQVSISFNPQPVIAAPPVDLFQCDDGTTAGVFDLRVNDAIILGAQNPALFVIKYYETLLDSQNDTNMILGPTVHLIVPPSPQRIYVRIEDLTGSCFALADFDIYFSRAIAGIVPLTFNVCDFDSDGGEFVDLFTEFNSFVLDGEPSSSYDITYHSSQADADGDVNPLGNPYFVTAPNEVVYIRLENRDDASCFDTTRNVDIIIDTLPVINTMPPTLVLCDPNNDGFAEFDLSVQTPVITLGDPALGVTYHGTLLDAQSGVLALPLLYINDDIYLDVPVTDITDPLYGTGGVWARVESSVSTCFEVVSFALEVRFAPVATTPAEPLRQCDDGVADGFTFFDLTVVEPEVLGVMSPTEFDIYYYEDNLDAITAGDLALTAPDFSAAIPTPMAFLNSVNPQDIYILVVGNATSTIPPNPNSGEGCYDIVVLQLIVDPVPVDLGPFEIMLCDDDLNGSTLDDEISTFDLTTQDILVNGGDATITVLWFATVADEVADLPIVAPTMFQNTATPQTVIGRATSAFGCSSTVTLTLTVLPNPNPKTDPTPLELCDDDDDGLVAGFDLTLRDVEIIDGEVDVSVLYYEDLVDAQAGIAGTEIAALYTNIVPFSQIVYARVTKDVPPAAIACYTIVELELVVIALPDMPDSSLFDDPFLSCDESGSGTAIFDLTLQDPGVLGVQNAADFAPITYYETLVDAQTPINAIAPANSFISGGQPIWVRLESLITGCVRITEFQVEVGIFPTAGVGDDLFLCDDEIGGSTLDDGLSTFDLTVNTPLINLGDFTLNVVYYATLADQVANVPIVIPDAYQNVITPQHQIFVSAFSGQGCAATSTFYINVEPLPITGDPGVLIACDSNNDGFTEFDLSTTIAAITLGDPALSVTYHGTFLDANNGVLPLPNPYTNEDIYNDVPVTDITDPLYGTGGVWARVETTANSCHRVVPFALEVHAAPVAVTPEPLRVCDDAVADGFTEFDLTVVELEVLDTLDPTQFDIYYYEDQTDAITAGDLALTAPDFSLSIPNTTTYTNTSNPQDIYVLVVGNATSMLPPNPNGAEGCYDIVVLQLIVDPLPLDLGPFEMFLCDDDLNGSTLDDEISTFDLTTQDVLVNGGDASITVEWFETPADEMANIPIVDPTMYQNLATPQTIIGRPTTGFGCSVTVTLTLTVLPNPNPNLTPDPLELCDDDDDGIVDGFDLSLADADIIGSEPDVSILYYEDLADAQAGTVGAEIPVGPYTNITPNSQIVYARVTKDVPPSALGCYTIVELELIVIALPDMPDATFQDPFLGCDLNGSGDAIFDLTLQDISVLGLQNAADFAPITYYETLLDAQGPINAISPANAFLSTGQTIWVRLESLVTGCFRITQFEIEVVVFPTIAVGDDLSLCDDEIGGSTNDDGLSTFDLTLNTPVITLGNGTLTVVYYATAADQASDTPIAMPNAYQNSTTPTQEIFVSVFSTEGCEVTSSFMITVDPNPTAVMPTALVVCDDDNNGFAPFTLSDKDMEIVGGAPDVGVFGYFLTEIEAQTGDLGAALSNPYTNIVANMQTVWARVQNTLTGCYDVVPLELIVNPSPDAPVVPGFGDLTSCDGMGGGDAEFNLEDNTAFVYGVQDPLDYSISYHTDALEADAGINPIANTTNFVSSGQTIWVRLENNVTGCYRVSSFELIVGEFPLIADPTTGMQACDDPSGGSSSDGIAEFDLTLNDVFITIGDPVLSVFYYETQADQTAGIFIDPATAYQNTSNPMTLYVSVFNGTGCSAQTTITLSVNPNPEPITPAPLVGCDTNNDGIFSEFILTDKDGEITGGQPDVTISYHETLSDAENGVFALVSPYENIIVDTQIVYARAFFPMIPSGTGCYGIVELELIVSPTPLVPNDLPDLILCSATGFGEFDLTSQDVLIYGSQDPTVFDLSYHTSLADAQTGLNAIVNPTTFTNTVTPEQSIYVRLLDPVSGCFKTEEFLLKVSIGPLVTVPDPLNQCDDLGEPNDGITAFDLTQKNDEITGGATGVGVRYYETQEDADNDTNRIDPETAYINTSNPQTVYVRVIDGNTECADTSISLRLRVIANPTPITPDPIALCDDTDSGDEMETFDLTIREGQILNGQNWSLLYYEDQQDAIEGDPLLAIVDPTMHINMGNPQTIYVRVTAPVTSANPGCFEIVELEIIVNPLPDDTAVIAPYNLCEANNNGVGVFDLMTKDLEVLNGQDASVFEVLYFESPSDAAANMNAIVNPGTYQNTSNPQTIYVGIRNIETECYIASMLDTMTNEYSLSFDLEVLEGATATTPGAPYAICDTTDPNDGFSEFDLSAGNTALYSEILGAQTAPDYALSFYATLEQAEAGDTSVALAASYPNIINPQIIYASVSNTATGCNAVAEVILKVEQLPVVSLDEEYRLCVDANGNPIPEEEGGMSPPVLEVNLDPSLYDVIWDTPSGTVFGTSVTALEGGTYTVNYTEIGSALGCTASASTTVTVSQPPVSYDAVLLNGAFADSHTVQATAEGLGSYVFQLDDGPFIEGGLFENVSAGVHTVTIKDANGCGSVTLEVGVIDYPRYLTPNQDGFHDSWNIVGIAAFDPSAKIYIFDRFGKLLKQVSPLGTGWNGTYNGNPLPSSDYWFVVEYLEEGIPKEFKGHFTLKR